MRNILKITRYYEWYDSKWNIYLYVFMLYWIRHGNIDDSTILCYCAVVMLFSFSLLAFGYTFNNYSDAKEDLLAGKANYMTRFTKSQQLFIVFSFLVMGIAVPVCISPSMGMLLIVLLSFLMAFLYSYRRFEVKQRGLWGLTVSSLAQRVCPMFVIFYLFNDWSITTFILIFLSFFVGLRWILVHQAEDHDNDKLSHTNSFVVNLNNSNSKILLIITLVFLCELSCLFFILILNVSLSLTITIPIAYILFQLIIMPFWIKIGWKRMILSYDFAPLADFYYLWSGGYLATALSIRNLNYSASFIPVLYFGFRYIVLDYKYIRLVRDLKRGNLSASDNKRN